MYKITIGIAVCMTLFGVTACQSGGASGPDEFRVVKKAPLVIPPEYNLRPPQPGQAQPSEVDPARSDIAQVFGTSIGQGASASERALVQFAGASAVNPIIREQIDYEEAKVIRKSQRISDRVLFWRDNREEASADDTATGGQPVTIERGREGGSFKLPGT